LPSFLLLLLLLSHSIDLSFVHSLFFCVCFLCSGY
jgi:hypothetical protein